MTKEEIKLSPKITNNGNEISLSTIAFYQGKEYDLQDLLNNLLNQLQKKDNIIDKAIEYMEREIQHREYKGDNGRIIKYCYLKMFDEKIEELLEILKGSDKE